MYLNSYYTGNNTVYFNNGSSGIYRWGRNAKNKYLKGAGTPLQDFPIKLKGYYKFEKSKLNDSIIVATFIKKYSAEFDSIIIVGFGASKFPPTDAYREMIVDIERYSNESPDSIIIQIETSTNDNYCDDFEECNFVTIDQMSLDFASSTKENIEIENVIYPNPTNGIVNIVLKNKIKYISIFNILGIELESIHVNSESHSLNINNFPDGIYFVQVTNSINEVITQSVLKLNR